MKSSFFGGNDVYFMEVISDKIIINHNYEGVIILDQELNIIKEIKLIENLIIDDSYIKDNEVVLYCYENECLIYINVDLYNYKIIAINKEFKEKVFLHLHEWIGNDLILIADQGTLLVHVNILDKTIQEIQKDIEVNLKFSICNTWEKLGKYRVYKTYADRCNAVVESDGKMVLYDYKQNIISELPINIADFYDAPSERIYHDIEVKNDYIVAISERKVSIIYNGKNTSLFPDPTTYCFVSGKFLTANEKNYFLLLLSDNYGTSDSKIIKCLI